MPIIPSHGMEAVAKLGTVPGVQ